LVPVKILTLKSGVVKPTHSPEKKFTKGVLMPKYSHSLCDLPIPMSPKLALTVGERIFQAINSMHQCEYLHGDIKPGNIFIDLHGQAWLGDYGSSVAFTDVERFVGGTARYQCAVVPAKLSPKLFDYMGLALTLLEKCELMMLRSGVINELDLVLVAISKVRDDTLRSFLSGLMPPPQEREGEEKN
jgi:serine/threonine protein kinase